MYAKYTFQQLLLEYDLISHWELLLIILLPSIHFIIYYIPKNHLIILNFVIFIHQKYTLNFLKYTQNDDF